MQVEVSLTRDEWGYVNDALYEYRIGKARGSLVEERLVDILKKIAIAEGLR